MPALQMDTESLLIDKSAATTLGASAAESYQSKTPYHYANFDNFLPEDVLDKVLYELESLPEVEDSFNRAQERLKTSYIPERLPPYTKNLFYALNSRPFLMFLEQMSGIDGLIPDPYFSGGGIHVVANGGHLDIHADFNHHAKLNLERRMNVLIYLNKDWEEEFGGSFEIWENDMSKQVEKFTPIFNRMVCFSTSSTSMHGNPETVAHPDGIPRRSIALYYYTATWDGSKRSHTTQFKPRPGTVDKTDWEVKRRELVQDFMPPILHRTLKRAAYKFGILK